MIGTQTVTAVRHGGSGIRTMVAKWQTPYPFRVTVDRQPRYLQTILKYLKFLLKLPQLAVLPLKSGKAGAAQGQPRTPGNLICAYKPNYYCC